MDSHDYEQKVFSLLNDNNVYFKLKTKSNPLNKITKDVNAFVHKLFKDKKIMKDKYYWLHCSKGVMPRFYGLPKIHKINVPLRPIVSFINSPTYNLSKFLAHIINNLVTNKFYVKTQLNSLTLLKIF